MERNEVGGAIERLESLIRLVDVPDFAGDSTLSDLKLLAGGFLDLLRLKAAGAKAEAAKTAAAPPRQPEAPPAAPPVITPAVPINQRVPSWTPPSALAAWELGGAVRVTIGPDGKVADAAIQKSVHPAYDTLLLTAARGWLYKPALKDGVPVASESTVTVVIKPR
jgi:TonB family protein